MCFPIEACPERHATCCVSSIRLNGRTKGQRVSNFYSTLPTRKDSPSNAYLIPNLLIYSLLLSSSSRSWFTAVWSNLTICGPVPLVEASTALAANSSFFWAGTVFLLLCASPPWFPSPSLPRCLALLQPQRLSLAPMTIHTFLRSLQLHLLLVQPLLEILLLGSQTPNPKLDMAWGTIRRTVWQVSSRTVMAG